MKFAFHEKRSVGLLLTFIGGMMDSYTYISYGVFSCAQTGNIILAIIDSYDEKWDLVGKKLLSTCFFFLGIILSKFIIDYFKKKEVHFWRLYLLYFEAFFFIIISLNFLQSYPTLVTIMIVFTTSVQWGSFDKINGLGYTNVFTTGNLKGVVVNLYDFCITRDANAKSRFIHYFLVVTAFILGAIISVFFYRLIGRKTLLIIGGLFFYLAVSQTVHVWHSIKTTILNSDSNKIQ